MTREQLEQLAKRKVAQVTVPGVGTVHLRSFSVGEAKRFLRAYQDEDEHGETIAVVAAVCDASGTPLFTAEDIPRINEWDAGVLGALAEAIFRHYVTGLEERRKNSASIPSDASSSA